MKHLLVTLWASICLSFLVWMPLTGHAQPTGFSNVEFMSGWDQVIGITFDVPGTMYAWEKKGVVWIVDNGVKRPTPLIDLQEEVGNWRDFGLVGFALDPSYATNGFIYLLYAVDRHHLLYFGTPAYNPTYDEYFNATIGRVTRYTVTNPSDPANATVNYNSRLVLLGETISEGIPILHQSHGVGTMLFGEDETLLISAGDGASYFGTDVGGPDHGTFTAQALVDGIISPEQNVGSYRSQMLNSYNGRVMRLDKSNGNGVPSNPFFDPNNPRSAQSRTWALGFRNPARFALKPGTGSSSASNGNPGVLMVGDVGWFTWEELNIVTQGGQNFGWPLFEGMERNPDYDAMNTLSLENPTPNGCGQAYYSFEDILIQHSGSPSWPDPCNPGLQIDGNAYELFMHRRPSLAWHHNDGTPNQTKIIKNGQIRNLGEAGTTGSIYSGNASIGGVWYTGTNYGVEFQNTYFHADYGERWIKAYTFDANYEVVSVTDFEEGNGPGRVVNMAYHPAHDGVYFIKYGAQIRQYTYSPTGNQVPTAVIEADTMYAPANSLSVSFSGLQSTDPEGQPLLYFWNFGDGTTSNAANPTKVFSTPGSSPTTFTVSLRVEDQGGLSNTTTFKVYLNNTPPVINSTSLDGIFQYSVIEEEVYPLNANVTDAEHGPAQLTFAWQTTLHHDNHTHPEPVDYNENTSVVVSPIGCDGPIYFYRIELTVTDAEGLSSSFTRDLWPRCAPLVLEDQAIYVLGQTLALDVLDNDLSEDGFDLSTMVVKSPPSHGNLTYNAGTGIFTYVQDGTPQVSDHFTYQISDANGDTSAIAHVNLRWKGPPKVTILTPEPASKQDNKALRIKYAIQGDSTLLGNMQLIIDTGTPVLKTDLSSGRHYLLDVPTGQRTLRLQLLQKGTNTPLSFPESADTVNFEAIMAGANAKLQLGIVENVGTGWTTVTLDSTYTSMVVVATPVLPSQAALPVVTRVRNVGANSFQLRVQNPSGAAVSGYKVHYIAVEAGVYTEAVDGIQMEAARVTSTRTGGPSGWPKEKRNYSNAYVAPVVLAQVQTANDANWSVAYVTSNDRDVPANNQQLFVSKHVAQDPNTTRANETVGYIVFETGETVIRGHPISARVGFEGVLGVGDSPTGFTYNLLEKDAPAVAILTSAGINSAEGGWPVLFGSNPITPTALRLAIDEDQIADAERNHGPEQIAYLVIDSIPSPTPPGTFPVELLDFEANPIGEEVHLQWRTATEQNNDFFTVERSQDGVTFAEVLRRPGAGNSSEVLTYRAVDAQPLLGRSYYRLRQTDFDGSFSFSPTVAVFMGTQALTVYPNPVTPGQPLMVDMHLPGESAAEVRLIDLTGRTLVHRHLTLTEDRTLLNLPTAELARGTYLLQVTSGRAQWVEKVILR